MDQIKNNKEEHINGISIIEIEQVVDNFVICDTNENWQENTNHGRKILSNWWSVVVTDLINNGNHHFSITINVPLLGGDSIGIMSKTDRDLFELDIVNKIYKYFPTLTFIWFTFEKNKNGITHMHGVVSIRNFIDYSYIIRDNLINILITTLKFTKFEESYFDFDVKVDVLKYFKDVKNWIIYIQKDIDKWKFSTNIYFQSEEYMDKLISFGPGLGDLYLRFEIPDDFTVYTRVLDIKHTHIPNINSINGIKLTYNKIDQCTLLNLLKYYLILNEYYIYNNDIYEKIKDSNISYQLVGSVLDVLYKKFQENVIIYFTLNFECYFKGFDFNYLLNTYFVKTKSVIEVIKDISTQRIKPDFSLIEFNDGVYSIKYDRFFSNKSNKMFNSMVSTIKFYKKSYEGTRRTKPINWINGLKNALNIEGNELNNENFTKICLYIINTLHRDLFNKKSTLFIYGKSNTGKTTLVVDVLGNFFGSDNVGSIISSKNFKWQDIFGKNLAIMDEGRYHSTMSSDLLKLTGQEKIVVEKKYSKEHISINPIPIFILSNLIFEDKDPSIDEALKNRMFIIEFINEVCQLNLNSPKEFKKHLKNEESSIIVFCNKLLFKFYRQKKIGQRISNEKLIKLIENNRAV